MRELKRHVQTPTLVGAMPVSSIAYFAILLVLIVEFSASVPLIAMSGNISIGPDRKVKAYQLESIELRGSSRIGAELISRELSLIRGTPLDDEFVMSTRARLLSLGLFKSVILIMKKGSEKGWARLLIEVEDDDLVLTDWALGGSLALVHSDNQHGPATNPEAAPMGSRLELVGRNLFNSLHRGALLLDFDSSGILRNWAFAYGLPRFAVEQVQFDAEVSFVDPVHRYLDVLGFGGRSQALWSHSYGDFGELQYGVAMYFNQGKRYNLPGFPRSVAGPKISYVKETRFKSFLVSEGHALEASIVMDPADIASSVFELSGAATKEFSSWTLFTLGVGAITSGLNGYAMRTEARLDLPILRDLHTKEQGLLFAQLRLGVDETENTHLNGSAAILGIRYHSSGFIAELALQITRSPQDMPLGSLPEGAKP